MMTDVLNALDSSSLRKILVGVFALFSKIFNR